MHTLLRPAFLLTAIASLLLAASAFAARDAVLTLKDGRTVKGEVIEEDDKAVTLLIAGIKTPYSRDLIKSIEFVKSVEEEFAERRAKIKDDDVSERFKLARWAYDRRAYALAKKEIDELLKIEPKNEGVQLLKRIVEEKLKAADTTPGTTTPGTTTPGTTTPNTTTPAAAGDLPKDRLDAKQINKIRVLEIDETQTPPPRVTVSKTVLDKFIAAFADDEKIPKSAAEKLKLNAKKDIEKLKLMLELGAKDFFQDVVVHDDPPAIRDFHNIHKNYVVSYCATNECHGGAKAGKFFLFNTAPNAKETVHTNFYILTQTKPKNGYMVDRDFPTKSLLIQYGLPLSLSKNPHPNVPGYKPHMLTGEKDRTYQMLVDWIGKSLYRPEPKYDLNYKLPSVPPPAAEKKDPLKAPETPAKAPG